ncbi:MAG: M48 family metallopeptidase [Alphaproteobacteria bacterium]|nr:M48 family metallopeptidase [Alphaproteobacteria bacterium]
MRLLRIAGAAVLLLMVAACSAPATLGPRVSPQEIQAEEMAQQRMFDEVAKTGGRPRPWRKGKQMSKRFAAVAERLEPVAAKICQEMGLPKLKRRCYFYFKLKLGDEINAYADGDTIIFTYGIMRFFENDDELAMVMAHELAHNLMGHLKAQRENMKMGLFLGEMMDNLDGGYSGTRSKEWRDSGVLAGALAYSQSFEAEADYIGLYIAARAGYDMRKALDYWRRLSIEHPELIYVSTTHPSNPERIAMLKKGMEEIEYKRKHRLPLLPEMKGIPIEGDYKTKTNLDIYLEQEAPWLN